ncbi:endonuclease MutS2 [Dielma fastidiosa]|uniref:Endonuclease MutS2 n=1 Tax=Dielma fastidiosa TaxID=1034346 RepID=A0AB35UNY4_9FIRM|nr:endonuclease MutS2 [Dielma fastidiosa]MDY5166839.1 endonuclease MutS2 [Dielma fastidiosa]
MKESYEALELEHIKREISRYCAFSLGVHEIMNAKPYFDSLHVKRELRRSREAIRCTIQYGTMPLGGVHDLREALNGAKKGLSLSAQQLRQCADQVRCAQAAQNYMKNFDQDVEALLELSDALNLPLSMAEAIEKCISVNYEVMDSASAQLKSIRKTIKACEADVNTAVQSFIQNNSAKLMDTITTTRNDRICVLVKISEKNSVKGFIHGESASGQTAYIEPESLIHANNKLQSARSAEQEEIERILQQLSSLVKKESDALISNCETFGLLDAIFAKARWAKENDSCVAEIDDKAQRLYLKKARHPLIDPKKVIANTYEIALPKRILLITGSNTGGKTVTLKTLGLFVLMSMCGFPIPCEEAVMPLYDGIFVDIGDEQSIEQSLSTFSAHLSKLAAICDHTTDRSLILLDELGSGTDPKEGEALAIAILDYLRTKNAMVVATTHYSQLKAYGARWDEVLLSSVEFDMEKMQPTYRYIEGLSGKSNAFEIARRFGLNNKILTQAAQIKEANKTEQERSVERLEDTIQQNMSIQSHLEEELKTLRAEQEAFEKAKEKFESEREKIIEDAKEKAFFLVEEAREESEAIIQELKDSKAAKPHELLAIRKKLDSVVPESEPIAEDENHVYAVGDYVQIKKYNYYGEVQEVSGKYIHVLANGLKMKLKPEELLPAKKQKVKKPKSSYAKSLRSSISLECNVIGLYVDEALAVIDKYLDNAVLANVSNVRLVHGVGTGALRNAIHAYLKKNPRVAEFRMGGQGEGGLGATVVTLKTKGK